MRKTILLPASTALAVLLASGVAWAATIQGTEGDDVLRVPKVTMCSLAPSRAT
jgi:hypothetical protein